jgi:hypothetical protein
MDDDVIIARTERWFVRQGVPQLIAGYRFRSHVLPRLAPFVGGALILGAVIGVALALAGASVAVLAPAVVGAFALLAAAAALITGYGLVPLASQAVRHAVADMRNSIRLQGRALPTLLFVTFFLFFTGELWQLMNHLSWPRLALVLTLFAAVTVLATSARLRGEVDRVEHDLSPQRLALACAGTPLAALVQQPDGSAPAAGEPALAAPVATSAPLTGRQETNLLLVLAARQLVQAAVVGLGLFAFFVVLGAIVVDDTVAATWIGDEPRHAVWLPWLPAALLRAAALLAGFGSMYFAITAMTQTDQRREFFDPVIGDVERMLAVRAVYLGLLSRRSQPSDAVLEPGSTRRTPARKR